MKIQRDLFLFILFYCTRAKVLRGNDYIPTAVSPLVEDEKGPFTNLESEELNEDVLDKPSKPEYLNTFNLALEKQSEFKNDHLDAYPDFNLIIKNGNMLEIVDGQLRKQKKKRKLESKFDENMKYRKRSRRKRSANVDEEKVDNEERLDNEETSENEETALEFSQLPNPRLLRTKEEHNDSIDQNNEEERSSINGSSKKRDTKEDLHRLSLLFTETTEKINGKNEKEEEVSGRILLSPVEEIKTEINKNVTKKEEVKKITSFESSEKKQISSVKCLRDNKMGKKQNCKDTTTTEENLENPKEDHFFLKIANTLKKNLNEDKKEDHINLSPRDIAILIKKIIEDLICKSKEEYNLRKSESLRRFVRHLQHYKEIIVNNMVKKLNSGKNPLINENSPKVSLKMETLEEFKESLARTLLEAASNDTDEEAIITKNSSKELKSDELTSTTNKKNRKHNKKDGNNKPNLKKSRIGRKLKALFKRIKKKISLLKAAIQNTKRQNPKIGLVIPDDDEESDTANEKQNLGSNKIIQLLAILRTLSEVSSHLNEQQSKEDHSSTKSEKPSEILMGLEKDLTQNEEIETQNEEIENLYKMMKDLNVVAKTENLSLLGEDDSNLDTLEKAIDTFLLKVRGDEEEAEVSGSSDKPEVMVSKKLEKVRKSDTIKIMLKRSNKNQEEVEEEEEEENEDYEHEEEDEGEDATSRFTRNLQGSNNTTKNILVKTTRKDVEDHVEDVSKSQRYNNKSKEGVSLKSEDELNLREVKKILDLVLPQILNADDKVTVNKDSRRSSAKEDEALAKTNRGKDETNEEVPKVHLNLNVAVGKGSKGMEDVSKATNIPELVEEVEEVEEKEEVEEEEDRGKDETNEEVPKVHLNLNVAVGKGSKSMKEVSKATNIPELVEEVEGEEKEKEDDGKEEEEEGGKEIEEREETEVEKADENDEKENEEEMFEDVTNTKKVKTVTKTKKQIRKQMSNKATSEATDFNQRFVRNSDESKTESENEDQSDPRIYTEENFDTLVTKPTHAGLPIVSRRHRTKVVKTTKVVEVVPTDKEESFAVAEGVKEGCNQKFDLKLFLSSLIPTRLLNVFKDVCFSLKNICQNLKEKLHKTLTGIYKMKANKIKALKKILSSEIRRNKVSNIRTLKEIINPSCFAVLGDEQVHVVVNNNKGKGKKYKMGELSGVKASKALEMVTTVLNNLYHALNDIHGKRNEEESQQSRILHSNEEETNLETGPVLIRAKRNSGNPEEEGRNLEELKKAVDRVLVVIPNRSDDQDNNENEEDRKISRNTKTEEEEEEEKQLKQEKVVSKVEEYSETSVSKSQTKAQNGKKTPQFKQRRTKGAKRKSTKKKNAQKKGAQSGNQAGVGIALKVAVSNDANLRENEESSIEDSEVDAGALVNGEDTEVAVRSIIGDVISSHVFDLVEFLSDKVKIFVTRLLKRLFNVGFGGPGMVLNVGLAIVIGITTGIVSGLLMLVGTGLISLISWTRIPDFFVNIITAPFKTLFQDILDIIDELNFGVIFKKLFIIIKNMYEKVVGSSS